MEDITTRLDGITFTDRFEGHSPKIVLWQDGSIDAKARPATLFISKDDKLPKVFTEEQVQKVLNEAHRLFLLHTSGMKSTGQHVGMPSTLFKNDLRGFIGSLSNDK